MVLYTDKAFLKAFLFSKNYFILLAMQREEDRKFSFSMFRQMLKNTVRLLKMVWPDKKWLFIAYTVFSILIALIPITNAAVYGLLINEIVRVAGTGIITNQLVFLMAATLGLYLFRSIINDVDWYLDKLIWLYLEEKSQFTLLEKLGKLDAASFEDPKQRDLFQKVSEGGTWRM